MLDPGLEGKSLSILTPMYDGNAKSNWINSFAQLIMVLASNGIPFSYNFVWNESLITRARNRLADRFLKNGKETHCVFIDSDIGFEPSDILMMLREENKDIIGVPASKKSLRWDRIQKTILRNPGQEFSADQLARLGGDFVMNFVPVIGGTRQLHMDRLEEMRNMGTGLMMVRREVFLKYRDAYPDWWYEPKTDAAELPGPIHDFFRTGVNVETREYDSEDYCFCHNCRAIGLKVWMAPGVRTTHVGSYTFYGDLPAVAVMAGEIA